MATNFCGSLFLQIGDFLCVLWELIFAIRTDWFFLLGINFCDFQKVYPAPSIDNIFVLIEYKTNIRAIEIHIFKR